MKKDLGNIQKVALRDVWGLEPEFTRWLAEEKNLSLLGEELGIDLSLVEVESDVGDFNADILAVEASSNEKVIIENQFGTTDHDHLGKIITYSSGHEASYVIWIFEEIREEHRQAIDWLNAHTTEDVSFFAIKLELWQIEGSKPAPKFDIICRPNDWAKIVKRQGEQHVPSEGKLRQLEFWTQLRAYSKNSGSIIKPQSPQPQHWTNISIGASDVHISLTMNMRENRLGCELYINDDKGLFNYLKQQSVEIEKEIGTKLEWIEATKATRILQTVYGFDILNQEEYKKHFDWLLSRAIAFKNTFANRIKNYK
jgi:hypothetical protein